MGHVAPFEFQSSYQPAPGMDQFLAGTPGVLGMSAMDAALDLWHDISLDQVFIKSQALTAYFVHLVEQSEALSPLSVIKPPARGSQVSLRHKDAFAISQALIEDGIICDFRAPDIVRFGFAPLYTRFQDVAATISQLEQILSSARYQNPKYQVTGKVT
jgi:kynureninase